MPHVGRTGLVLAALAGAACAGRGRRDGWTGVRRPPAGADSAAVEAWVAAQARRCPRPVARLYSEGAVADSAGAPFRMRRYFDGIECPPA